MTDNFFSRQSVLREASEIAERDGNDEYADFDMGKWFKGIPYLSYHGDIPVEEPWSFEKSVTSPMLYLSQFIEPSDSVIDIGCGAGGGMRFLKEQIPGIQVTGLTNSRATLETCQGQFVDRVILGDFTQIPATSLGHYDVAYLMESFFYFGKSYKDKVFILKKIKEVAPKFVARIIAFPDEYPQPEDFWGGTGLALTLTELKNVILEAGWSNSQYYVTPYLNDQRFAAAYSRSLAREIFKNVMRGEKDSLPQGIQNFLIAMRSFAQGTRHLVNNILATHVVASG